MIFNSPTPDSIPNKTFLWKRLFIFLLDGLMSLIVCFALVLTAGNATTKAICKEEIIQMNVQYKDASSAYDVSLKTYWEFGLYQVDEAKYINDHLDKGESRDEIDKKLDEIKSNINKKLNANQSYKSNYKKIYIVNKMTFVVCMLIPLIAFQLIVPLCTKKRQTLFMKAFKTSIVRKKTNVLISHYQVLIRFLIIFTVEFLPLYILTEYIGELILIFISVVILLISPNKTCLHDLMSQIKVVDSTHAYTESQE